jgi:hypothetical protein
MSQTFTEDCFAAGHVGLTDLQNMEDNFMALKTLFSGSSAPSNSTGGMPWFDTAKKILKLRNSTNGAWLGVHYSSTASRWWVYANTAGDGWIVDSSVADVVISIKGGAQSYNAAGGTQQGTWTISGLTNSGITVNHTHGVGDHTHGVSVASVSIGSSETSQVSVVTAVGTMTSSPQTGAVSADHAHLIYHSAVWRPLAAVGTLQYLDM